MNCTIDNISNFTSILDKCNFIKQNCQSEYINTLSLYYCTFKGNLIFSIPSFILIILFLFLLLSSTSDLFLGSAITKIVEIFNINQNIAALTLLAFGNGAPDIIPSLVSSSDTEGVEFSLGNILGTSFFSTSFVLGTVIFFSKEIEINPKMFNRDLILYIISLIFITIIGFNGKIHFIESLGFIIIYCFDVFFAIFQEKSSSKNKNNMSDFDKLMDQIEKMDEGISSLMEYQKFSNTEKKLIEEEKNFEKKKEIKDIKASVKKSNYKQIEIELEKQDETINSYNDIYDDKTNENSIDNIDNNLNNNIYLSNKDENKLIDNNDKKEEIIEKEEIKKEEEEEDKEMNLPNVSERPSQCSAYILDNIQYIKLNLKKNFYRYKEKDWDKASKIRKLFYLLIDYPLIFLREITIPLADEESWNKYKFCIMPISCFLFICLSLNCKLFL